MEIFENTYDESFGCDCDGYFESDLDDCGICLIGECDCHDDYLTYPCCGEEDLPF